MLEPSVGRGGEAHHCQHFRRTSTPASEFLVRPLGFKRGAEGGGCDSEVMAFAVDELDSHLDFCRIPVIDLRFFSQDEINCAAQCSDEYTDLRFDNIVIPKIDRSIFNESAGSRKQTYSRLRLSQRREQLGSITRRRAGLLSVSRHSVGLGVGISSGLRRKPVNAAELNDNNQILQMLRELFMKGDQSSTSKNSGDEIQKDAVSLQLSNPPLNSESGSNHSVHSSQINNFSEKSWNENQSMGPKVANCLQLVARDSGMLNEGINGTVKAVQNEASNGTLQHESADGNVSDIQLQSATSLEIYGSRAIMDDNLDRPKKKMRTKEDARRKAYADAEEQIAVKLAGSLHDNTVEDLSHTDKGGAGTGEVKPLDDHSHTDRKAAGTVRDNSVGDNSHTDRKVTKENNSMTETNVNSDNIWASATQDPFVPQLKRKFAPLETEAELHDFFDKIGGQWASKRKKRKIVDAGDFGEGLPKGWKLLLGVRKKDGRYLIECRKYISPEGHQFASCREVHDHLRSTLGHYSAIVPAQQTSGYSDENTHDYHRQTPDGPSNSMDQVDNTGEISKQSSPKLNCTAFLGDEEQQALGRNVSTETVIRFEENSSKDQHLIIQNTPVKCSKCNINFSNRSTFMVHKTIHHGEKVKKTGKVKSISDGVIITNGKYECQICHKVFEERNRYTGHVGVHVRRNAKRLRVSSDQTSSACKEEISVHRTFDAKLEEDTKIDVVEETLDTKVSAGQGKIAISRLMIDSSSPSGQNDLASSPCGGLLSTLDAASGKDGVEFSGENHKFDGIADFEQFPMGYMQSPKFSFETGQDAHSTIDASIELGLDAAVLQQDIDPPGQFGWDPLLSKMGNSPQLSVCVWCNTEFSRDGLDTDQQADSVGFICPVCKTKISGQVNI